MELFVSNAKKIFPKVICVGKNYIEHVKEMGGSQAPKTPVIFLKPWTTVNYDPKILSLPSSAQHRIDHELELGVFIEKGGKNIAQQDAMGHVGGYFIGIDFSDRGKSDIMETSKTKQSQKECPGHWQNVRIIFAQYRHYSAKKMILILLNYSCE